MGHFTSSCNHQDYRHRQSSQTFTKAKSGEQWKVDRGKMVDRQRRQKSWLTEDFYRYRKYEAKGHIRKDMMQKHKGGRLAGGQDERR